MDLATFINSKRKSVKLTQPGLAEKAGMGLRSILVTSLLASLVHLINPMSATAQPITIGEDGIVRCRQAAVGTTQTLFGEVYEVVDRDLLIRRRDEGQDLTRVCVSLVTDMSEIFKNRYFNQPIGNWDMS
jgi:hypothetical protein